MAQAFGRLLGKGDTNMNYVLMIHAAEARFATMTKASIEAVMQAYGTFTKDLMGTGRAGDCAALEATSTATSVQIRDGKRIVKDGPFAETREQLGGYYAFNAENDAEAHAWAARIPDAKGGTIEVRPVVEMTSSPIESAKVDPKAFKEYLLLVYEAESNWASLSEAEQGAIFQRYGEFSKSLRAAGQFLAGEQLDTIQKAKSVSVDGDRRVVRDGPFAETREQLGGYYRVLARDLDEAIKLATRIPAVETGTIEIRPIADTSAYA
jgi:hypothetical protein